MNKLLNAGFTRLWKNKCFWLGILGFPIFIIYGLISNYNFMTQHSLIAHYTLDNFLFLFFTSIGLFTSVFSALFLGTEYSDGTMRNKLAVGHDRTAVYLSSLIVCFVSSLLVCAVNVLITFALGVPLFGMPEMPASAVLMGYGFGILMVAALSALFTLLAMLITNKPVTAVVCTVGFFALFFISAIIFSRLDAPQMIEGYTMTTGGEIVTTTSPNPRYLEGAARKTFELLEDLIPTGASLRLSYDGCLPRPLQASLCLLFVTVACTVAGLVVFRKKDLK